MRRALLALTAAGVVLAAAGAARGAMRDAKGSADPALFTRMPGFTIYDYRDKPFDSFEFRVTEGGRPVRQPKEGHLRYWKYVFDKSSGAPAPSKLQVIRNYQAAAAGLGGTVVYEHPNVTTIRIAKDGGEVWVEVAPVATGTEYALRILERQAMKQDVAADAEALKAGLASTGHVELHGVYFDTGKADLKPESEAALKEIAKLLAQAGDLKVWVVGHTDSVGSTESNLALSAARAAAVAKHLTGALGVDPKRLGSFGAGPYAPVATNATEEGRAKNRRVELVAQP